jgi:hypothetical protein
MRAYCLALLLALILLLTVRPVWAARPASVPAPLLAIAQAPGGTAPQLTPSPQPTSALAQTPRGYTPLIVILTLLTLVVIALYWQTVRKAKRMAEDE